MKWQDIRTSENNTFFVYNGKQVFDKVFIEVLKFHSPGLAPVMDETGAYHINGSGHPLYSERYDRTFGFYCKRASVVHKNKWFHIDEKGERLYGNSFSWSGNYQENICSVRDESNNYFHIEINGDRIYNEDYVYCGDFKDGIACVKLQNGSYKHINRTGDFIYSKSFLDLGVFHKNFATAKDQYGWFHIDKNGEQIYMERYLYIEPFYNGFALVTCFDNRKKIIDENGKKILDI